jgi:hypothetical protein
VTLMTARDPQVRAPTVEEKECPACGEVKRAALYYPNTIAPDGLSEKCRSCCKSQAAEIRCGPCLRPLQQRPCPSVLHWVPSSLG